MIRTASATGLPEQLARWPADGLIDAEPGVRIEAAEAYGPEGRRRRSRLPLCSVGRGLWWASRKQSQRRGQSPCRPWQPFCRLLPNPAGGTVPWRRASPQAIFIVGPVPLGAARWLRDGGTHRDPMTGPTAIPAGSRLGGDLAECYGPWVPMRRGALISTVNSGTAESSGEFLLGQLRTAAAPHPVPRQGG